MKYPAQISLFLAQAKQYVESNGIYFAEREQSISFLAARGLMLEDLETLILTLTVTDWVKGPEPDYDPAYADKWTVAVFSPDWNGEKVYLKLSIRVDAKRCKCLSVKLWSESA